MIPASPDIVFQIGVAPLRVDIMTSISGVSFAGAWSAALIANKKATGRAQDVADIEALTRSSE